MVEGFTTAIFRYVPIDKIEFDYGIFIVSHGFVPVKGEVMYYFSTLCAHSGLWPAA